MLFFWKFFSLSKRHMLPKCHTHKLFVFVNHPSLYPFRFQFPYYRCFVFFNDFIFLLVLSVKKNIAISYNLSVDIHMYIPAWSNFSVYANCHFYLTFCSPKIHDSNANQIYFPHQATTNVNNACVFLTILCKPLILKWGIWVNIRPMIPSKHKIYANVKLVCRLVH